MKEFEWFGVDHQATVDALVNMFIDYKTYKGKAIRQANKSTKEFNFGVMVDQLKEYLNKYLPDFPQQVQLELPKLGNLPKLKKLEDVKG